MDDIKVCLEINMDYIKIGKTQLVNECDSVCEFPLYTHICYDKDMESVVVNITICNLVYSGLVPT